MAGVDEMRELVIERVLRCVEQIPPGRVASYGLIGRICGVGPRQVGSIMSHYGSDVPWGRVTNAAGEFPPALLEQAEPHWAEEGILVAAHGRGCRYRDYAFDDRMLSERWQESIADLPAPE